MAKFEPGEKALLLTTCRCTCGDPSHPTYPSGSIVTVHGVGPFGPGLTMLDGQMSFLPARFDYWIMQDGDVSGFMVNERELSKLLPLDEKDEEHERTEELV